MNPHFINPLSGRVFETFYQSPPIHQNQSLSSGSDSSAASSAPAELPGILLFSIQDDEETTIALPIVEDFVLVVFNGSTHEREVRIRNDGSADLEISAFSISDESEADTFLITLGGSPVSIAPGDTHVLVLEYVGSPFLQNTAILNILNNSEFPTIAVPLINAPLD